MNSFDNIKRITSEKNIRLRSPLKKRTYDKLQLFIKEAEAVSTETMVIKRQNIETELKKLVNGKKAWVEQDIFPFDCCSTAEADIAVQKADFGIAETGTVVVTSALFSEQLPSLLPMHHVAVVNESDILRDTEELFGKLGTAGIPHRISFITGPSKTADIELNLVKGVHGPGKLTIVIVENDEKM